MALLNNKRPPFGDLDGCPSFMLTIALSLYPKLLGQGLYLGGIEVRGDDDAVTLDIDVRT